MAHSTDDYSGLNLNQDKATKPQTVQIVRQGEVTPYWFKVNPLYFDYPRGRVIIVYTASTVFFAFGIGYYALLFTIPALICGLILSLTSIYRDLRGLIRAGIVGSLCGCLYLLLFGADFISSLQAGVVIGGTYSLIVGVLSLHNPPGEDDIREPA